MTEKARILSWNQCAGCTYPVVFAPCNEPFSEHADAVRFDYWLYCANKTCAHHHGDGVYSGDGYPLWVESVQP